MFYKLKKIVTQTAQSDSKRGSSGRFLSSFTSFRSHFLSNIFDKLPTTSITIFLFSLSSQPELKALKNTQENYNLLLKRCRLVIMLVKQSSQWYIDEIYIY